MIGAERDPKKPDSKFIGYRCSLCTTRYSPHEITYTCPKDGVHLEVVLDCESMRGK